MLNFKLSYCLLLSYNYHFTIYVTERKFSNTNNKNSFEPIKERVYKKFWTVLSGNSISNIGITFWLTINCLCYETARFRRYVWIKLQLNVFIKHFRKFYNCSSNKSKSKILSKLFNIHFNKKEIDEYDASVWTLLTNYFCKADVERRG